MLLPANTVDCTPQPLKKKTEAMRSSKKLQYAAKVKKSFLSVKLAD